MTDGLVAARAHGTFYVIEALSERSTGRSRDTAQ
jgi:hypothetical protein